MANVPYSKERKVGSVSKINMVSRIEEESSQPPCLEIRHTVAVPSLNRLMCPRLAFLNL